MLLVGFGEVKDRATGIQSGATYEERVNKFALYSYDP